MAAHRDKYAHKREHAGDRGHYQSNGRPKKPMTREQAEGAALHLSARPGNPQVHAYECWCGAWHTGRIPTEQSV